MQQAEGIEVEAEALTALGEVGAKGSLRYAVQMLTPARILAETYGRDKVRGSWWWLGWMDGWIGVCGVDAARSLLFLSHTLTDR